MREFVGDVQGQLGGGKREGVQDCTRTAGAVKVGGRERKRAESEKKKRSQGVFFFTSALLHHSSDRVIE